MRYQPTDRPTDRAYYRDARTHLKRKKIKKEKNEKKREKEKTRKSTYDIQL